ncbi:MAG: LysM peptidoglycan-binding domain-containing protein [Phycisphaerales bacterium]|nr:LysM peptidoglycan-binding domain-containing protein [Phycisphaerales bacterium]
MNRELKLALIIGFSLVLLVTVLISDHLSKARGVKLAEPDVTPNLVKASEPMEPISGLPGMPANKTAVSEPVAGEVRDRLAMGNEAAALPTPTPETSIPSIDQGRTGGALGPVDLSGAGPSQADKRLMEEAAKQGVELAPPLTREPEPIDITPGPPRMAGSDETPKMREYTVVEGDSMVKIAKKTLGDANKWNLIAQANPKLVGKKGEVRIGAKLRIPALDLPVASGGGVKIIDPLQQSPIDFGTPGKIASNLPEKKPARPVAKPDAKGSKAPSKAELAKADAKKPAPSTYTVKQGDTLNTIAKRLLGSASRTEDLIRANPDLESEDAIQVGDVIKVPMS